MAVLGLFTPGSPNAERQMDDFDSASKVLAMEGGPSASFVQIATGEDVKAYNLDDFSLELNGSWPLLLDEGRRGTPLHREHLGCGVEVVHLPLGIGGPGSEQTKDSHV